MLKYGRICDIDAAKGLARVEFQDDGITSGWLPVTTAGTSGNTYSFAYDVNSHVACLMDEHAENGVVIGAIYSKNETPPGGNKDKVTVTFSDGASVEYDRAAHKLAVKVGTTELDITQDGFKIKRGGENFKQWLTDLLDAILAETHPTPAGPSGPPLNSPQYTAIKARIADLFT